MKTQSNIFKWAIGLVLFLILLGSTSISPSVYAQGETVTTTPLEGTVAPTITPTPTSEESFMPLQNEEQPFAMLQSLEEENRLNPEWPVFNISDSNIDSVDSSTAIDITVSSAHFIYQR